MSASSFLVCPHRQVYHHSWTYTYAYTGTHIHKSAGKYQVIGSDHDKRLPGDVRAEGTQGDGQLVWYKGVWGQS